MFIAVFALNVFRSRPLREGRLMCFALGLRVASFRSTPLREGRPQIPDEPSRLAVRFDPRPCARGDLLDERLARADDVSIHAPARGATRRAGGRLRPTKVSIHAPARGATLPFRSARAAFSFRSTPLREGRRDQGSIARGARKCFDPRPCARGDGSLIKSGLPLVFRSTPLREGRPPPRPMCRSSRDCFDPRPCARGDSLDRFNGAGG